MPRALIALTLILSLSGCWRVYFVGPQVGANVRVVTTDAYRQAVERVSEAVSMNETEAVSFFVLADWWATWPEGLQLPWLGSVDIRGEFEDDAVYLVVAEGGIDIDPESRGAIARDGTDYPPAQIVGKVVVYAYGRNLKRSRYGLNPIAGAVTHYLIGIAPSDEDFLDDEYFRSRLDEGAELLTEDITGDGVVNWEDLLAFNMQHDMDKFIGSQALLDAYIEAINTEEWTEATFQAAEDFVVDAWRTNRNKDDDS